MFRALNPKNPRDTSKRVWSPDGGMTIRFRYHHTDLVTYTANTLTITPWGSLSSVIFINELAPSSICARGSECCRINGMRAQRDALLFRLVGGQWVVDSLTVEQEKQTVVDRKVVTRVAKQLRPFIQYRRARDALTGREQFSGAVRVHWTLVAQLEAQHADPTAWPHLYERLAHLPDIALIREFVAHQGGVKTEPLPVGVPPRKSVYDQYAPL